MNRLSRLLLLILLLFAVADLLSACGRKALPDYPPDAEYPRRQWPSQ